MAFKPKEADLYFIIENDINKKLSEKEDTRIMIFMIEHYFALERIRKGIS
jgi:hypothetical protein